MGWLQRLFGLEKPHNQQGSEQAPPTQAPTTATATQTIPPERVGLNGEYDQSGLAKRVALAFDQHSDVADINTVYVAQTGSTVVLKGTVPSQDILTRLVQIAKSVNGATSVETNQVNIG